jgi:hypothetical protein
MKKLLNIFKLITVGGHSMGKILAIVFVSLLIIAGTSYGEPSNLFTGKDSDLYFEGWYGLDASGNLSGMLTIDIINRGSSPWNRIDYSGITDFHECSQKPGNWTCQYDSNSNIVSLILKSGEFSPQDRVSFVVMYNNPLTKILTGDGFILYSNSDEIKKMEGLTRVQNQP